MEEYKIHKPSFTILQRAQLLGNKKIKPIDRSDRFSIDNWELEKKWSIAKVRTSIMRKTENIKNILNIPKLNTSRDLISKHSCYITKECYIGVNSNYLKKNPEVAKKLEKAIHINLLLPLNWSYNFYPFLEYLVLYGRRSNEYIMPNPNQLQLILTKHKELGRNKYTKSDREYLKQQARIISGATSERSSRKQAEDTQILSLLFEISPSDKRPPRNTVLAILCFRLFNTMSTKREEYLDPLEKQYNQYLKLMVPELIVTYNHIYKTEIKNNLIKKINTNEAYSALLRYHHEYLKYA